MRKTMAQTSFAVTAKLISAFVFATQIEQFLYFLNPKFPASIHLLCLYSWVCIGPCRKSRRHVFMCHGSGDRIMLCLLMPLIEKLHFVCMQHVAILAKPDLGSFMSRTMGKPAVVYAACIPSIFQVRIGKGTCR